MRHKAVLFAIVVMAVALIPNARSAVVIPAQEQAGVTMQQKIDSLKELRDSGVISQEIYQAKLNALRANSSVPVAAAHAGRPAWQGTRTVEITDARYGGMRMETLEVPSNWRFAGTMDVSARGTCHALEEPGPKFTMQSPDGLYQVTQIPGVMWQIADNPRGAQYLAQKGCPSVEITTAADFMVKILLAQLHPNAKVAKVLDAGPGLLKQMEDAYEQHYPVVQAIATGTGMPVPEFKYDGARMRVEYTLNGVPVEEALSGYVECRSMRGGFTFCSVPEILMVRAPQGQLESLLSMPEFSEILSSKRVSQDWERRHKEDRDAVIMQGIRGINQNRAAVQAAIDASNFAFQNRMAANQRFFDTLSANNQRFNEQMAQSTNRSIAQAQEKQRALDASAYQTTLFAGDKAEFTNPYNGQTVISSNKYAQQFISNNGQYVIQTGGNDNANNYEGPGGETFAPLIPH